MISIRLALCLALVALLGGAALVSAQSTCPAGSIPFSVNGGVTLRVRAAPLTGAIQGTVSAASGLLCADRVDAESGWYHITSPLAGWVSNGVAYVSTATPGATLTPSPTRTPTARPPTITPTRIITNTPLAPGYIATQSTILAREICFKPTAAPAGSRGDCFLLKLDDVITDRIVQIQP